MPKTVQYQEIRVIELNQPSPEVLARFDQLRLSIAKEIARRQAEEMLKNKREGA